MYEACEDKWKFVQLQGLPEGLVNPSYLCLDNEGEYLYCIHGDRSEASAFARDPESGKLGYLNTVSTEGVNPVHLSVDRTNRWVFVANLQTGTVVVLPRYWDGTLGEVAHVYEIAGIGKGGISHPHQVTQDRAGNYLFVSCQGRKAGFGQVDVFRIHHDTGELENTCVVKSREIAEPRHLVVHPNNRWCYGVNEKDYSVTAYNFDSDAGLLAPRQILPTLPETYTGDGWASGIAITGGGDYVVVSNRKHDSITSFAVDQATGMLHYRDCVKTGGEQPRFITMAPTGNAIWAANELSDTIDEFLLDAETGALTPTGRYVASESPVCLIFA